MTGVALKDERRLVPKRRWLQILTGAFLLFGLASMRWPAFATQLQPLLGQAQSAGWPDYVIGTQKTFLPLPHLVHALALAYFLSSFGAVRRVCATIWLAPFALLGRQALPVFALGSIMVFALQAIRAEIGFTPWQDTWMLATGLTAMFALAAARTCWPKDRVALDGAKAGG